VLYSTLINLSLSNVIMYIEVGQTTYMSDAIASPMYRKNCTVAKKTFCSCELRKQWHNDDNDGNKTNSCCGRNRQHRLIVVGFFGFTATSTGWLLVFPTRGEIIVFPARLAIWLTGQLFFFLLIVNATGRKGWLFFFWLAATRGRTVWLLFCFFSLAAVIGRHTWWLCLFWLAAVARDRRPSHRMIVVLLCCFSLVAAATGHTGWLLLCFFVFAAASTGWLLFYPMRSEIVVLPTRRDMLADSQVDCSFVFLLADVTGRKGWFFSCLARLANRRFHCCFCFFSRRALESPALVDWLLLLFSGRCHIAGWLLFLFCWFPVGCTCLLLMWGSRVIVVFVVSFCRFAAQVDFIVVLIGTRWLLFLFANRACTGYVIFLFCFSPVCSREYKLIFFPLANFE